MKRLSQADKNMRLTVNKLTFMTQEERWNIRYEEVKTFIENNKRNPSKYVAEERNMVNFLKHTRKQMNQGLLKPERIEAFKKLQELIDVNKHVNQYK